MYQWLLYGHLIGVILLVLGTGMFVAGVDGLRRCDDVKALRTSLAIATLGTRTLAPGGVLLLGFGIAMAILRWSLADAWIAAALLLVALLGANGLHAERRLRVLATALDHTAGAALPPALRRLSRAPALHASNRAGLPLLAELEYLMTMKPGIGALTMSLLIAAAAVGLVTFATIAPLRRRRAA